MNTCLYHTVGCGLSTPCRKCREATSRRNVSTAAYRSGTNANPISYWLKGR